MRRSAITASVLTACIAGTVRGQPGAVDGTGGSAYIVRDGTLLKVELATMALVGRRTFRRGPGPWDNCLAIARSEYGLTFAETGRDLVEAGGVPDLMIDAKGRVVAAYQYFPDEPEEAFNTIAISVSSDGGETWQEPQLISIVGLPPRHTFPCDPDIVLLPDGRVRLYFTSDLLDGVGPRTLSAVSADLLHFQWEEGDRFADPPRAVLDPSVVRIGDRWHFFAPYPGREGVAYHAVSADGLRFERAPEVQTPGVTMLGNVTAVAGGYRFYGSGPGGIRSAVSGDGYGWRVEQGTRLPGSGDPGVVRLPDGTFLMVHVRPRR